MLQSSKIVTPGVTFVVINYVYHTYPRLSECGLTYWSSCTQATTTIPHYMPAYRVFQLYPLDSGCRYRVFLTCQDKDGVVFRSNNVTLTTGITGW